MLQTSMNFKSTDLADLVDTHAHIDDIKYTDDRDEVVKRAKENGVTRIITMGDTMKSSENAIKIADEFEGVFAATGVHPQEALSLNERTDYDILADWMTLPKVKVLGEIGLDYYYENASRELQKEIFIRQLDVARQMHMPVSIHDRDAHGDMMAILKKEGKGLIGSIHCFSGSYEMAKELLKMGWFLGVDGPVTFKNAAKLPEIIAKIPLDRLLLETDSPYLAPVPKRGKRNEPAYVKYIAEKVAEIRGTCFEDIALQTTKNAVELFDLE